MTDAAQPAALTQEQIVDLRNEICVENGWMASEIQRFHALCDLALRAERDAERYQHLKRGVKEYPEGWYFEDFYSGAPSLETLDAAIDRAIQTKNVIERLQIYEQMKENK